MFKNVTYKQKFLITIAGFVLLFMAAYKKTFKHAIAAKTALNIVEKNLSNNENSVNELYHLKNEIGALNKIIGGQSLSPELAQQKILDFISKSEFKTNIVSIEDVHLFQENAFLIYTNQIELQGTYNNLVHLLYDVEKHFNASRVVSTQLYSKKNYRNNTKNLFLKIILQNYENTK